MKLVEYLQELYGDKRASKILASIARSVYRRGGRSELLGFLAINDTSLSRVEITKIADLTELAQEQEVA